MSIKNLIQMKFQNAPDAINRSSTSSFSRWGEAVARRMSEVRHLQGSADWKLLRTKKLGLLQGRLPSVSLLGW